MFTKHICSFLAILMLLVVAGAGADDDKPAVKNIKAINWEDLGSCLPDKVEGMDVGEVDGGSLEMTDPSDPKTKISYSTANRIYTATKNKDKSVTLNILDSNFYQFLLMPFMMAMEIDTPSGSVKSDKVADFPAKVIIQKDEGEITGISYLILVSERILVSAEADENVAPKEIENLLEKVDFEKLAKLTK